MELTPGLIWKQGEQTLRLDECQHHYHKSLVFPAQQLNRRQGVMRLPVRCFCAEVGLVELGVDERTWLDLTPAQRRDALACRRRPLITWRPLFDSRVP